MGWEYSCCNIYTQTTEVKKISTWRFMIPITCSFFLSFFFLDFFFLVFEQVHIQRHGTTNISSNNWYLSWSSAYIRQERFVMILYHALKEIQNRPHNLERCSVKFFLVCNRTGRSSRTAKSRILCRSRF